MNQLTKNETDMIMDLILAELEIIRKIRIKFSDQQLRESESVIEQRLRNLYSKLNEMNFEAVK